MPRPATSSTTPRRGTRAVLCVAALLLLTGSVARAGVYSTAMENENPGAPDGAIAGFVGPDGDGKTGPKGPNNYVNPIFVGWATGYTVYDPFGLSDIQNYREGIYANPENVLGPVTGENEHIASLGDMSSQELSDWRADPSSNHGPGSITLSFESGIGNDLGADFAVFENAFISGGGAGVAGEVFAELAYVEVSSNGSDFARFPSVSLTEGLVGDYGTVNPTNVYNLAGKHVNAYGDSWGTPFDLDDLLADQLVLDGLVDLSSIEYVRLVDVPGDGSFEDSLGNPIYDAWLTWGSGGLDLEAVGVLHAAQTVPEPSTLVYLLMASGLLGFRMRTRAKRR